MAFATKTTPPHLMTDYSYEGKQICLTKQRGRPTLRRTLTKTQKTLHSKKYFDQKKKIECATVFAVARNYERVSGLTGVPVAQLKRWNDEPWWHEIIAKVKKEKNEVLDGKITETLDKTLDMIQDRVENGETYYNPKSKEYYNLPLKAKDAAIVTSILFDKRQLIRGEATSRTESISSEEKLLALKQNFENLAKSKLINPNSEPIEVEYEEINQTPSEQEEPAGSDPQEAQDQGMLNADLLSDMPASVGGMLREDEHGTGVGVDSGDEGFSGFKPQV